MMGISQICLINLEILFRRFQACVPTRPSKANKKCRQDACETIFKQKLLVPLKEKSCPSNITCAADFQSASNEYMSANE